MKQKPTNKQNNNIPKQQVRNMTGNWRIYQKLLMTLWWMLQVF